MSPRVFTRALTVLAAATLASTCLAGCRTNVGVAASVDGKQITESEVSSYVTPSAQPVQVQTQTGYIAAAPRSFVLETLIDQRLFGRILEATPIGAPNQTQLAAAAKTLLKGASPAQFASRQGVRGFTEPFDALYVQVQTKLNVLISYRDRNVDLQSALRKVHMKVAVSPRYGKWHKDTLSILSANPQDVLPGFIRLQSTGSGS